MQHCLRREHPGSGEHPGCRESRCPSSVEQSLALPGLGWAAGSWASSISCAWPGRASARGAISREDLAAG